MNKKKLKKNRIDRRTQSRKIAITSWTSRVANQPIRPASHSRIVRIEENQPSRWIIARENRKIKWINPFLVGRFDIK